MERKRFNEKDGALMKLFSRIFFTVVISAIVILGGRLPDVFADPSFHIDSPVNGLKIQDSVDVAVTCDNSGPNASIVKLELVFNGQHLWKADRLPNQASYGFKGWNLDMYFDDPLPQASILALFGYDNQGKVVRSDFSRFNIIHPKKYKLACRFKTPAHLDKVTGNVTIEGEITEGQADTVFFSWKAPEGDYMIPPYYLHAAPWTVKWNTNKVKSPAYYTLEMRAFNQETEQTPGGFVNALISVQVDNPPVDRTNQVQANLPGITDPQPKMMAPPPIQAPLPINPLTEEKRNAIQDSSVELSEVKLNGDDLEDVSRTISIEDLNGREAVLTGNLKGAESLDHLELSLDGGSGWQRINSNPRWSYSFKPVPDQEYNFKFRAVQKDGSALDLKAPNKRFHYTRLGTERLGAPSSSTTQLQGAGTAVSNGITAASHGMSQDTSAIGANTSPTEQRIKAISRNTQGSSDNVS